MVSLKMPSISERDLNTKLTLIFTKIGQLDKAQEGIQELYELLLEYPECDVKVNAFLASAGTFFQNYLRKALDEITTRKMQACGMSPKPSNDKKSDFNSNSINKKIQSKFPSTSNRCSHSSIPSNNNTKLLNINNHGDSSNSFNTMPTPLSLMSGVFMDKVSRETFEQTRSRLHSIFQYEQYKTGQKRSSLQEMHQFQTDSDRLEFAKSILQSKPRSRRATWMHSSSTTFFSPHPERFSSIN